MGDARVISISELLHYGRPVTGAASLSLHPAGHRGSGTSSSPSPKPPAAGSLLVPESETLAPLTFQPLTTPVALVGTLGLSRDHGARACSSGNNHCFSFSDGSARVCCAILDLDISVVGSEIRALAWNFLPLPRGGGVLEIIRWSLTNPVPESGRDASPPHFPQLEERSRIRSCAWGVLVAISPVFSVATVQDGDCEGKPYSKARGSADSLGFLAEVTTCKCDLCTSAGSLKDLHQCLRGRNAHSFNQKVIVYFRGLSSSWRPVLSQLLAGIVTISGLKKKYVSAGGGKSLVFATTEKTVVYADKSPVDNGFVERRAPHSRKCEVGTYSGVVTGIFKKGMVVELDKKDVWLLFTDPLLDLPHSLRVGAVIIVKNVHFIRPNFSWIRILLLSSCIKTTVEIKSFSLVDTRTHSVYRNISLLWDFIYLLPFSARFWALLLVSSFQRKFAGIFSDKEILGSRKKEGLVQKYCKSSLHSSMLVPQLGVFEDFCNHDRCSCRNNLNCSPLKLVVPMANFIAKCKTIWMCMLPQVQIHAETRRKNDAVSHLYCEEKYHERMIRRVMSSKELGLVLVGSLQVCPSSGRLQLVDSTGCVDVVIPDISPNFDQDIVYEVEDYTLVVLGFPLQLDSLRLHQCDPVSCRSILQHFQLQEELHGLMIYVHFYVRNLRCFKTLLSSVRVDDVIGRNVGDCHLLLVTHKFPRIRNFQGHSSILDETSAFAEAIFLPYDLILQEKYQDIQPAEAYELDDFFDDIPCLVTFANITYRGYLVPWNLSHKDGNSVDTSLDMQGVRRILLEFKSSSINKYQLLCIGTYYLLKSSKEHLPHGIGHNEYMDSTKVLVTSQTRIWTLEFSPGELLLPCLTRIDQSLGVSAVDNDVSPSGVLCQSEKLFHHCADVIPESFDAHVHVSDKAIGQLNRTKLLGYCLTKAHEILGQIFSVSSFIQVMTSMSLQSSGSVNHQDRLPAGNLISLRGNIMDIHICHHDHSDSRSEWSHKILVDCVLCIHVYEGHHMVKVRGTLDKSVYPLGLGPGANATFHRVLTMVNSRGHYELMMIPVSCIVVNYVEQLDVPRCTKKFLPLPNSFMSLSNLDTRNESLHMSSSRLISELIHFPHRTRVRLHCRVIGTYMVLLDEQVLQLKNFQSAGKSKMPAIRIPLAGFILDDGSSSCCCWADDKRAQMLLQLQETAFQSFLGSRGTSSLMGNRQSQVTLGSLLKRMLKKHHRITIRNFGANIDSHSMEATFSVDSIKAFTSSEEDVLRSIVYNAQNGPCMNVIGYMLNLNELPLLDGVFMEADFFEQSMKHLWAEEVGHAYPLMEGRNLIKELLPR